MPTPLDPATWAALQHCLRHRESLNTTKPHVLVTKVTKTSQEPPSRRRVRAPPVVSAQAAASRALDGTTTAKTMCSRWETINAHAAQGGMARPFSSAMPITITPMTVAGHPPLDGWRDRHIAADADGTVRTASCMA